MAEEQELESELNAELDTELDGLERGESVSIHSNEHESSEGDDSECPICFDVLIASKKVWLVPCGHAFCQGCMEQHAQIELLAKHVPICCPERDCDTLLSEKVLRDTLSRDDLEKYQHQILLKTNAENFSQCPFCELPSKRIENINDQICCHCQRPFCDIHGATHSGMSCRNFQQTPAYSLYQQSEAAIHSHTKACSHCGCRIFKSAGCDHVLCSHCRNDMCWTCGTHVHLEGKMIRSCTKCKREYRDHRYDHVYRKRLCLALPFLMPLFAAYVALALVGIVISGCCCGCFKCGRVFELNDDKKGRIQHGVLGVVVLVLLPIVAVMVDFGFHVPMVDKLFPEKELRMPVMEVENSVGSSKEENGTNVTTETYEMVDL